MIDILGKKRVLTLLILGAINAGIGYSWYMGVVPGIQKLEIKRDATKSSTAARQADLWQLQDEWQNISTQLEKYKAVQDSGFFDAPYLALGRDTLNKYVNSTGNISATFQFKSEVKAINSRKATEIDYVVISKPVSLAVTGFDDNDVYNLVHKIQQRFPGRVAFTGLTLERTKDISVPVLQQIGSGTVVQLVKAKYDFEWQSMVKKSTLDQDQLAIMQRGR